MAHPVSRVRITLKIGACLTNTDGSEEKITCNAIEKTKGREKIFSRPFVFFRSLRKESYSSAEFARDSRLRGLVIQGVEFLLQFSAAELIISY